MTCRFKLRLQRRLQYNHEGNYDITNHGHKVGEMISKRPEESYNITHHGHKAGEMISKRPKESFHFLGYDQKFMAH